MNKAIRGSSEYPNHYALKKARLEKFRLVNGKCERCGKVAVLTHHSDGNKSNHSIENLVALCRDCHYRIHSGRKNGTSKWKNLLGMTLQDIAKKSHCSASLVLKVLSGRGGVSQKSSRAILDTVTNIHASEKLGEL